MTSHRGAEGAGGMAWYGVHAAFQKVRAHSYPGQFENIKTICTHGRGQLVWAHKPYKKLHTAAPDTTIPHMEETPKTTKGHRRECRTYLTPTIMQQFNFRNSRQLTSTYHTQ